MNRTNDADDTRETIDHLIAAAGDTWTPRDYTERCPECGCGVRYRDEDDKARCYDCDEVLPGEADTEVVGEHDRTHLKLVVEQTLQSYRDVDEFDDDEMAKEVAVNRIVDLLARTWEDDVLGWDHLRRLVDQTWSSLEDLERGWSDFDGEMIVDLTFTHRLSGALHKWRFTGNTETREAYPEELIQGGESYGLYKSEVPSWVREELEEMGYEVIEG